MAGAIPGFLAEQSDEFEGVRGNRIRQGKYPTCHEAQITSGRKRKGGREMKTLRNAVALAVVITSILAATVAFAASDAQKSFEQLKGLSGSWEGKTSDGKPIQADYRLTAMGSALMSEI